MNQNVKYYCFTFRLNQQEQATFERLAGTGRGDRARFVRGLIQKSAEEQRGISPKVARNGGK